MNYNNTVAEMRRNGFKVRVGHYRLPYEVGTVINLLPKSLRGDISDQSVLDSPARKKDYYPRGGMTTVEIEKDGVTAFGIAECALADNYNKKVGVRYAISRAIEAFQMSSASDSAAVECPQLL